MQRKTYWTDGKSALLSTVIAWAPVICLRWTGQKRVLLSFVGASNCGSSFEGDHCENNDGSGIGGVDVNQNWLQWWGHLYHLRRCYWYVHIYSNGNGESCAGAAWTEVSSCRFNCTSQRQIRGCLGSPESAANDPASTNKIWIYDYCAEVVPVWYVCTCPLMFA